MGVIIDSGSGSNFSARVSSLNQLYSLAFTRTEMSLLGEMGRAGIASVRNIAPAATNPVVAYLGNNLSVPVEVAGGEFTCAAAEMFELFTGATTATFANNTPTNVVSFNRGGGIFPATVAGSGLDWEVVQGSHTLTTMDSNAVYTDFVAVDAAKKTVLWTPPARLILPPGKCLFFSAVTGSSAVWASLYFSVPKESYSGLVYP